MRGGRAPATPRRWRLGLLLVLAAGFGLGGLGLWATLRGDPPRPPLSADRAEVMARRVAVALDDVQASWDRALPRAFGHSYRPAELVLVSGPTEACGAGGTHAPFYCRETRQAVVDLAFLDALGERLRRQEEIGTALVVARILAEHVQAEIGLNTELLQADCLTGAWAASAEDRLGPVPPGFYRQLILVSRNVRADGRMEAPAKLDPIGPGAAEGRDAAFAAGYLAGDPAWCIAPGAPAG